MHIFLSGKSGVGKSTLIQKALTELNITPCGFVTRPANFQADGSSDVHILSPTDSEPHFSAANRVGHRNGTDTWLSFPEIFDTVGIELLSELDSLPVLMDELGFMESSAALFRARVMEILAGDLPVLGVIKPRHIPFTDQIRKLPNVKVLDITIANREQMLPELVNLLQAALAEASNQ